MMTFFFFWLKYCDFTREYSHYTIQHRCNLSAHAPGTLFLPSLFPNNNILPAWETRKLEFVSLKQNGAREIFSMVSRSNFRENCIFPQWFIDMYYNVTLYFVSIKSTDHKKINKNFKNHLTYFISWNNTMPKKIL